MLSKSKLQESIREIYKKYVNRHVLSAFTLESIQDILEIGNEVFQKNNPDEVDRIRSRPQSKAPDIMDDEPFSLDRALKIYQRLSRHYEEVTPELIREVFEVNSQFAWEAYRKRYTDYLLKIYADHPEDEYINYLTAIVLYDQKKFKEALKCINISLTYNSSSAVYTHLKGLCLMQLGELDTARTYLYQALFLVELRQDIPPRMIGEQELYPNYPIEFRTSSDLIRNDLTKLDDVDNIFQYEFLPLIN